MMIHLAIPLSPSVCNEMAKDVLSKRDRIQRALIVCILEDSGKFIKIFLFRTTPEQSPPLS